jgi:Lar family restriction alleviation protein
MAKTKTKPLPCPFCGGEAELDHVEHEQRIVDDLTTKFFYRCVSCACNGGWGRSESGALRYWNMRTKK